MREVEAKLQQVHQKDKINMLEYKHKLNRNRMLSESQIAHLK